MKRIATAAFAALALGLCACNSTPPPAVGYFGDTLTLGQLVERVNENNQKLPTLWARERFEAAIVDRRKNTTSHIDGYGNLLFTGPNEMKLTAKNEVADLFEMGSDGMRFWLYEKHDQVFWWGKYADLDKVNEAEIPVRPDMVMEVLGIRPVDTDLLRQPAPVMRFNSASDAYMIDWQIETVDHWAVLKEIWYDRQTFLPNRVVLFDAKGRVVLWARLSKFDRVETANADPTQWPSMAAHYDLFFPLSGTTMSFDLSDMSLSHNGFPNAATYRMPDPSRLGDSGVRVNRIDDQSVR
jgi:outer membrane lipoprotein-sorting protein